MKRDMGYPMRDGRGFVHTAQDVHNMGSKDFSSRNLSGTTSRLHFMGPPWAGTGYWKGLGSSL